jgi:hypothetical protein
MPQHLAEGVELLQQSLLAQQPVAQQQAADAAMEVAAFGAAGEAASGAAGEAAFGAAATATTGSDIYDGEEYN